MFQGNTELTDLSTALVESNDEFNVIKLTVYHNNSVSFPSSKTVVSSSKELRRLSDSSINSTRQDVVSATKPTRQLRTRQLRTRQLRTRQLRTRQLRTRQVSDYNIQRQPAENLLDSLPSEQNKSEPHANSFHQGSSNSTQSPLQSFGYDGHGNSTQPRRSSDPLINSTRHGVVFANESSRQGIVSATKPQGQPAKNFLDSLPQNFSLPSEQNKPGSLANSLYQPQAVYELLAIQKQIKKELIDRNLNEEDVDDYFVNNPTCRGKCQQFENSEFGPEFNYKGESFLNRTRLRFPECNCSKL